MFLLEALTRHGCLPVGATAETRWIPRTSKVESPLDAKFSFHYYDWIVAAGPLTLLLAAVFTFAGAVKLVSAPGMVEEFARIGIGQWFRYLTGFLEINGVIGIMIPKFRLAGALLMATIMIGATAANLTVLHLPGGAVLTMGLMALSLTLAWQWRPGGWRARRWLR